MSRSTQHSEEWPELEDAELAISSFSANIEAQEGSMEADKIDALPGQPAGVKFNQYSGYVTVDRKAGRSLFYYFAESPHNSSTNPLGQDAHLLDLEHWMSLDLSELTAMEKRYLKTLLMEQRFPQYKNRDFYITGESYGGHYVPQLAYTILAHNNKPNRPFINLKGIAIGNPLLDLVITLKSIYEYLWTHALISDETYSVISKECDYIHMNISATCGLYQAKAVMEMGLGYNPCSAGYVISYLNQEEVQKALHAIKTFWIVCSPKVGSSHWKDSAITTLPIIKQLIAKKLKIWIYSGDTDALLSVASTRYAIKAMKLPVEVGWRAWHCDGCKDVGGYVEGYKGLTLVTIRGAGHSAPTYQPERAFTMISSFLQGKLPPPFSKKEAKAETDTVLPFLFL
nr:putative serine carboxypeptidase-like 23 [Ipomoea trifida]